MHTYTSVQRMSEEDDLDAFFDEVSQVEAKAKDEDDNQEKEQEEPPKKKVKTAAPVIPRGVVVAAAASASARPTTAADNKATTTIAPPPPPPPPPLPPSRPTPQPQYGATISDPQQNNSQQQPQQGTNVNLNGTDDWPKNGFRLFVGNLSNEVGDSELYDHFTRYPSLQRAIVIRDVKQQNASKGYGFVSFGDALECARAKREMDQSWLASRPIRIKKYQGTTQGNKNNNKGKWKKRR